MDDDKQIGEQVGIVGNAVTEGIASAAGQAQTAAVQARDAAAEAGKQVADVGAKAGAQAADYVSRRTAEQPLIALLVAGAIGYALAYLIHAREPAVQR